MRMEIAVIVMARLGGWRRQRIIASAAAYALFLSIHHGSMVTDCIEKQQTHSRWVYITTTLFVVEHRCW